MALFRSRNRTSHEAPVVPQVPAVARPEPAPVAARDEAHAARLEQAQRIRRGGRPRTDDPRSKSLNVRFTVSEWERVEARAAEAGRPPRELARDALLTGRMVASAPREAARADAELSGQIARIGNNLNQVVRALNEAKAAGQLDIVTLRMSVDRIDAMRQELAELAR